MGTYIECNTDNQTSNPFFFMIADMIMVNMVTDDVIVNTIFYFCLDFFPCFCNSGSLVMGDKMKHLIILNAMTDFFLGLAIIRNYLDSCI